MFKILNLIIYNLFARQREKNEQVSIDDSISKLPDKTLKGESKHKAKKYKNTTHTIETHAKNSHNNKNTANIVNHNNIPQLSKDPVSDVNEVYNMIKKNISLLKSINKNFDLKRNSPKHYLKINNLIQQSNGALVVLKQIMTTNIYNENAIKIIIEHTNHINKLTYS